MSYQPAGAYVPGSNWTVTSFDPMFVRSGRIGATSPVGTDTAWIANLAVFVPFVIAAGGTIYEWWHHNGSLTTAYNVDYGIYNLDFTKVQSLGSTAGITTASTIVTTTTWTDLAISPGSYYMAFATDSTRNIQTSSDTIGLFQATGCMEQTTAFALPSPAVPLKYARAFLPFFGFNMRSIAI